MFPLDSVIHCLQEFFLYEFQIFDGVEESIPQNPRGDSIRCIASSTLRLGLTSSRIVQVVKDACADYLERIPNNVPITFVDTVTRMYQRWDVE